MFRFIEYDQQLFILIFSKSVTVQLNDVKLDFSLVLLISIWIRDYHNIYVRTTYVHAKDLKLRDTSTVPYRTVACFFFIFMKKSSFFKAVSTL